jgi:hypothetical protein
MPFLRGAPAPRTCRIFIVTEFRHLCGIYAEDVVTLKQDLQ